MRFSAALLALFGFFLIVSSTNPSDPTWANTWSAEFTQTTSGTVKGKFYYDFTNLRSRIDREDGQYEYFCKSEEITSTPCSHITVDGALWLYYPKKNKCCQCCTDAAGCGVLSPTWLHGAEYLGVETKNGYQTYKWDQKGSEDNYYYETVNGRVPVDIFMAPSNDMAFSPATYSTSAISPSLFELPSSCQSLCTLSTPCKSLQQEAAEALEELVEF